MELILFKHGRRVAGIVLALGVLWIGQAGLHRSLWLDEAWVANSIRANSLAEMFWGGEWLQTSPPLFLLIARAATNVFGLSTETLRAVPLLFACIAGIATWGAARGMAPLAVAALLFPSVPVEYFGSFKQYGAEAAAVAVVLWAMVEYRRVGFTWFAAIVIGLLPLAYPLAFLIPGLVWFVWKEDGWRRAGSLAVGAAVMLAGLYVSFIRPNVEPSLWSYWGGGFADAYTLGVWGWVAASVVMVLWAVWKKDWIVLACALPCLLLVGAELSGWYPASPRMRLFVRPCFVVGVALVVERLSAPLWSRFIASVIAVAVVVVAVVGFRAEPFEDYPAAVAYLRAHVGPGDILLVHPDARQGLLLYGPDLPAHYANTGWPCCARGRAPVKSSEAAVRADLDTLIPADYRGRVWLFYGNRPLHWQYLGLNEGELWRKTLWDRGCPPGEYADLPNLVISPMQCGLQR
jgi:hypothetical protein